VKFNGAKVKLSRKLGVMVTPKAQKYLEKKPYPPGQHGQRRRRRLSNYGRQLLEKQKLRFQYNVAERQLRRYFEEATRLKGVAGDNLVRLLETRLDALVLRAGFARTIFAARQYVSHGHFEINGKRVNIPSQRLAENDVLAIREASRKLRCFNEARGTAAVPSYLTVAEDGYSATLSRFPTRDEVPVICEIPLVIEFYSR
jgi:small subunit ribosomal protein S4